MASKLLLYMTLLGIGLLLGRRGIFGKKVYDSLDKLQMACLMLLLFMMGINLGADKKIVESLGTIGFKGIVFGLSTVLFSILSVNIYSRFVIKRGK
ncbi:MAG: LysO family transporter [Proteocatella sp.]